MFNLKKLILLLLFVNFSCVNHVEYDELRRALVLQNDGTYATTFRAYKSLMDHGEEGYKVLSDAWLRDGISENTWLKWSYDLMTRFEAEHYQDVVDKYHLFFSERLLEEEDFRSDVIGKIRAEDNYNDDFLLVWIRGYKGYRLVAYEVLKGKYQGIPKFDFSSLESVRDTQISQIEEFLRKKRKGNGGVEN